MLTAINPQNTSLATEHPVCHSQGELLYHIGKNNIKEVFIDRDLPGNLSLNAFIDVIKRKYPDVEVSVIESFIEAESEIITISHEEEKPRTNILKVGIFLILLQVVFSIAVQYASLTPMNIIYSIAAGIVTLVFFYGGYKWKN